MSNQLSLVADIVEEDGKKVINLYPEGDCFYMNTLRSHEDVQKLCDWLKERAREAWGRDYSDPAYDE